MSVFYMDTSAIAKRYLLEIGSGWVQPLSDPSAGHRLFICPLTAIEFMSILARRRREGKMTAAMLQNTDALYRRHQSRAYKSIRFMQTTQVIARQLLYRHTLRTLDAIHLALALEVSRLLPTPLTFVTSDKHLLTAAAAEGLPTDDPLSHP